MLNISFYLSLTPTYTVISWQYIYRTCIATFQALGLMLFHCDEFASLGYVDSSGKDDNDEFEYDYTKSDG